MALLQCSFYRHLLLARQLLSTALSARQVMVTPPLAQSRHAYATPSLSSVRHAHTTPIWHLGRPLPHVEVGSETSTVDQEKVHPPPPSPHTLTPSQITQAPSSPVHTEVSDDAQITQRYGRHPSTAEEEWSRLKLTWRQLPKVYLSLSKHRITTLVTLSAVMGYCVAPAPFEVSTLLLASLGTALCSASSLSLNQWLEVPYDSQMTRTRNRVLVKEIVSPFHSVAFSTVMVLAGGTLLWTTVNPLTAFLGVGNILLYVAVYTPLKRISLYNTWVGAIVGAIPPLMGWTACTGTLDPGAFVLAGILFAWQFPHFNALSWRLRGDYSLAGYRMMSVVDPSLCKRTTLRYCLALFPLCAAAPALDITTWWFLVDSIPVNAWMTYLAWRFYSDSEEDFKWARKLFQFTLFHLPLLTGLMLINKKHWYSEENTIV